MLSTGQGHGQVSKGHERPPESKILFGHAVHLYSPLHVEFKHSSHFAIWLCKSTTEKSQENPGSHKFKFSNRYFRVTNVFLNQFCLKIQKCHFHFCAMPKNGQNLSLKKWRHQRIRYLGYMFVKNEYINNKCGLPDVQARSYNIQSIFFSRKFRKFRIFKVT